MFKFLKDKLKSAISRISEGVEKEGKAEEKLIDKPVEEKKEAQGPSLAAPSSEKGFFAKIKEKIVGKEEKTDEAKIESNEAGIKPRISEQKKEIRPEVKPTAKKYTEEKHHEKIKKEGPKAKELHVHKKEPEKPQEESLIEILAKYLRF